MAATAAGKAPKLTGTPTGTTNMKNNKSLGQHWLKDREILDEIADLAVPDSNFCAQKANLPPQNTPSEVTRGSLRPLCLEIGPGLGTLTSALLRRFPRVWAIEFDENLAKNLPKSFPGKDLKVVNADFLNFDLSQIGEPYVVAGNIPYYITSPIITKLLTAKVPPLKIVLLMQKEVAERILAEQGRHTYLSIFVQNYANVFPGSTVPREYFTPPPKVDSAVVVFEPHPPFLTEKELKFVKASFSNPRKKLIKNLPHNREEVQTALLKLGISENSRPADLSLKDWKGLAKILKVI